MFFNEGLSADKADKADCLDRYISFLIKARFFNICFNMYPTLVELAVNQGRLLIVHLIERGRK